MSQALAQSSIQSQSIFLSEQAWKNCSPHFPVQGRASIESCGFGGLYRREKGECARFSLSSLQSNYPEQYGAALESCAQLNGSNFDDQCDKCVGGISNLIDAIIVDLGVQGDDEEEKMCSIASVIAAASAGIGNSTWVDNFYGCLPAMDTEGQINFSLFFSFTNLSY